MSVGIEALFTSALGLVAPWEVAKVELDTTRRRIDFEVHCTTKTLACPHCGAADQRIHDRLRRSWRHMDFFQFEAWLHADVPRVACTVCGKTSQTGVPWAREGSDFTSLFEALAMALCRDLPVRQAAAMLRGGHKQLWTRTRTSSARLAPSMTCATCATWASTTSACTAGRATSPSCMTSTRSGCCSPPRDAATRR